MPVLDHLTVHVCDHLSAALERMVVSGLQTVFVVDDDGRLVGVATDGDVRRALLAGRSLISAMADVMNHDFLSLPVGAGTQAVQAALSERIRIIPLLDDAGRPVDYASWNRHRRIPVSAPNLGGHELDYVIDCVRSGWVSSRGSYLLRFEQEFAHRLGVPHAVAVSSGTTALHLALASWDIGPGDEVIVPDLTFAATANAVLHAGATPVLVDVRADTLTLDPAAVEAAITPRTRAILPVHLFGQMADMDALCDLASRHGLVMIEDAAEALGSRIGERPAGTIGNAGCFSFFANKLITTGEGGMVVFNDAGRAERARRLRDHGMAANRRYWHEEVGFNYRMTNLQAALGCAQLERMDAFLSWRQRLAQEYGRRLAALPAIQRPVERDGIFNSHWIYWIALPDGADESARDQIIARMAEHGIETRPMFHPLHVMPPYRRFAGARGFPVSTAFSHRGLCLPTATDTTLDDLEHVTRTLEMLLHPASGNGRAPGYRF